MQRRLKVLISAYACEPGKGSEPGVGWNWVLQAARFHDVWAITRENNRDVIEKEIPPGAISNLTFLYFDLPRWARFWKRGKWGLHLYYYLWQLGAYFKARKVHADVHFDIAQHATFVSHWMPSFLALLPVPFVWGPLGGGESAPAPFWGTFGIKGMLYECLRFIARICGEHDPMVLLTARRAAVVLATTNQTATRLAAIRCRNISILSQVALQPGDAHEFNQVHAATGEIFRAISIGRQLHWKGFDLGLSAFSNFHRKFPNSEYWLVGRGPDTRKLMKLAGKLGVARSVRFIGEVPRGQIAKILADSHVLLHPSLHDSGGWVCAEAMAAGRPVICLDLGGPGVLVSPEAGIKVAARTPRQAIDDLSAALKRIATDERLYSQMGTGARRRISERFLSSQRGDIWSIALKGAGGLTCGVAVGHRSHHALERE